MNLPIGSREKGCQYPVRSINIIIHIHINHLLVISNIIRIEHILNPRIFSDSRKLFHRFAWFKIVFNSIFSKVLVIHIPFHKIIINTGFQETVILLIIKNKTYTSQGSYLRNFEFRSISIIFPFKRIIYSVTVSIRHV